MKIEHILVLLHQVFRDPLPVEHAHQREEIRRRWLGPLDLLKRQLPRCGYRVMNAEIALQIN